jgi:hypothetical protein
METNNGSLTARRESTLLTLEQFARKTGLSLEALKGWIARGRLTKKWGLTNEQPARIDLSKFASYSNRNGRRRRRTSLKRG